MGKQDWEQGKHERIRQMRKERVFKKVKQDLEPQSPQRGEKSQEE